MPIDPTLTGRAALRGFDPTRVPRRRSSFSPWFAKGICPECQRTIGGRGVGMKDSASGGKIELSRHKAPAGQPCSGAKRVVAALAEAS